jgi:hypothetical protein
MALFSLQKTNGQCPIANACTPGNATNPQATLFGGGIFQVEIGTFANNTIGASDGYKDYFREIAAFIAPLERRPFLDLFKDKDFLIGLGINHKEYKINFEK